MEKYFVELIGTFFLVLTIGLTAGLGHAGALAPLAIGCMLMVLVYSGGHISGAHYNPAATLTLWLRGRCSASDIPGYVIAQIAGAVLGALTAGFLGGGRPLVAIPIETGPVFVSEFLFTFALCWVILNVATAAGTAGNPYYGLAIGFVVAGAAYAVGPISGASLNPAVSIALCLMGLSAWGTIGLYFAAQLLGAAAAAFVFKVLVKN